MAKLTLTALTSSYRSNTALNANFDAIEAALENTLSRDGTAPNAMSASHDMGSNLIINQLDPVSAQDGATKNYVDGLISDGAANVAASAASAAAALVSENNAASSESNAATSETNAAASEANAAASYDSFDDRYLGAKSTAPTLDNDSNALLDGAMYFNDGSTPADGPAMYVYDLTNTTWIRTSDGIISVTTNEDTGDGSTVAFTLSGTPPSDGNVIVTVDGVSQPISSYSVSGTTLTFTTAPPTDSLIEMRAFEFASYSSLDLTSYVTKTGSDTLANKTLTSPVLNGTLTGTGLDPYVYTVDNIAALKALTVGDHDLVNIEGHTTVEDGGGGLFRYNSGSSATDDNGTIIAPTAGGGRWIRQINDHVTAEMFGCTGDGTTDDSTNFQKMLNNSNLDQRLTAGQTYLIGAQLLVPTGVKLSGPRSATIKADAALDTPIFLNTTSNSTPDTETDIVFEGFSIDGNKANQTPLAECTGIKMIKVPRLKLRDLYIYNTEGHGVHVNNGGATIEGLSITGCIVDNPGSSNVGTYGSCIAVTNGSGVTLSDLYLTDSAKAGLRISGSGFQITDVVCIRNGNGGIVPESGLFLSSSINGGWMYDNGPNDNNDGIRLVAAEDISINGVICDGNDGAGLMILNGCKNISVNGGTFKNNGQNATAVSGTTSKNGIAIKNDSTANSGITISGVNVYDDQGTPTQDYGISVENSSDVVTITGCNFGTNQTNPLSITTSGNDVVLSANNRGLTLYDESASTVSITGTTATTELLAHTVTGGEVARKTGIRLIAAGTITGTAGTKTFSINVGGSGINFTASAASDVGDWVVEMEIWFNTVSSERVIGKCLISSTFTDAFYQAETQNYATDTDIKLLGKLSNTGDDITMNWFSVRPIV